jgi:hypothetical protein
MIWSVRWFSGSMCTSTISILLLSEDDTLIIEEYMT